MTARTLTECLLGVKHTKFFLRWVELWGLNKHLELRVEIGLWMFSVEGVPKGEVVAVDTGQNQRYISLFHNIYNQSVWIDTSSFSSQSSLNRYSGIRIISPFPSNI